MLTQEKARTLTWRRLLLAVGAANTVVLLAVGTAARDKEALAFGALFAAAVVLLALRGGLAGVILVGILAVNTAVWMVPATAANIANREDLPAVMIPASLAAVSLTGAIAAALTVVRRRASDADGKAIRIVVQVAIAAFVLVAAAGVIQRDTQATGAADLVVEVRGATFVPAALEAAPGTVSLEASSGDLFWHTLTIDELGVDMGLPTRATRRVTFNAEPGTYPFYCAVPGHRLLGMEGTLTVR